MESSQKGKSGQDVNRVVQKGQNVNRVRREGRIRMLTGLGQKGKSGQDVKGVRSEGRFRRERQWSCFQFRVSSIPVCVGCLSCE